MTSATRQKTEADLAALADPQSAAEWAEKGRLLARLERNTSALAAFERAIELDPGTPAAQDAAIRQALLLEELDRVEAALAAYQRLVRQHPGCMPAWSNRAGLLMREGRFEEALESLNCALRIDPDNTLLCLNKGLLLLQGLDRPADAIPWIERALPSGFPEAAEALEQCQQALRPSALRSDD